MTGDFGQTSGSSSDGGASRAAGKAPPWSQWNRLTKIVLSAGALASAVGAILALWPSGDPEDSATVTSLRIHPMSMSEFEFRSEALSAAPGDAERPMGAEPQALLEITSVHGAKIPLVGTTTSPTTTSPTTTSPTTTSPTTTSPTTTPPTTTSPTTTSPSTTSPTNSLINEWGLSRGAVSEVTQSMAPLLEARGVSSNCLDDKDGCDIVFSLTGDHTNANGDLVSADEAAHEIVALLVTTRGEPGPNGEREPLGERVTADVEVSGLRGKSLDVFWSMFSQSGAAPLPAPWQGRNLAYRLHSSTDHDTGSFNLWIPTPATPGRYYIQLELTVDGAVLDSADSPYFGMKAV
jgi:hypothetical protein